MTAIENTNNLVKSSKCDAKMLHNVFFCVFLALMPGICVLAPRSMAFIPGICGVLGFASTWILQKQRPEIIKSVLVIVCAVLALAAISSFWSIDQGESLKRVKKMAIVLLPGVIFLSFLKAQDQKFYQMFMVALPVGIAAALGINWVELNSSGFFYRLFRGLPADYDFNISNLNRGVVTLALIIFAGYAALWQTSFQDRTRYICLAMYGVLFGLVFYLTHSQSAHLAFAVGLLAFLFFPVSMRLGWIVLGVILISLLVATPWMAQFFFQTIPPLVQDMYWFQYSYAADRMEIWDFVSRYALQNSLYGFGIEATKLVEHFDTAMLYHQDDTILHPHNFAVQIWMEFGALGIAFTAGFFAYMLKIFQAQSPAVAKLYLVTFLAFLSVASTGYGLWQSWWLGTMFLGAGYCIAIARFTQTGSTTPRIQASR